MSVEFSSGLFAGMFEGFVDVLRGSLGTTPIKACPGVRCSGFRVFRV